MQFGNHLFCHVPIVVDSGVVHLHRIHVDRHQNVQLFLDFPFDQVHNFMHRNKIRVAPHFHMTASHSPTRTVIVQDQIMHTNDFFMCQHQFFQLLHRFHICRLSQKIADRIPNDVESRFQNEQRNCRTHDTVHRQRCHQRQQ